MRSPSELIERFRQRGLRMTPQRQQIFSVLAQSSSHPTAEAVCAAVRRDMPTISLRTVYETLSELVEMGEIQQVDLGMGARRFDPNTRPHHHLVCEGCGTVRDIAAESSEVDIPNRHRQGFIVRSADVTFRGLCGACAREKGFE